MQRKNRVFKKVKISVDPFNESLVKYRYLDGKVGYLLKENETSCTVMMQDNSCVEIPVIVLQQDEDEKFRNLKAELFTYCMKNIPNDKRLEALSREIANAQTMAALEAIMLQYVPTSIV